MLPGRHPNDPPAGAAGVPAPNPSPHPMAYREFHDLDGVLWRAWDTYPTATNQLHVAAPLAGGWLSFETGDTRRRLYPVPAGWENASEHQLRYWLSIAE